ncbi:hypothetical protein F5878DRAFT_607230 [Lentinula raphanica]|uniref:Translation initiation factor 3 N-terminal domain-containing protein n=1 Tax=Lentinula raphanica TaxID=153919 RepID=A0AA38PGP3_9AGAR|nr:hypothetical protein F5878DRAFT_607230 [Lentinula raphanica]
MASYTAFTSVARRACPPIRPYNISSSLATRRLHASAITHSKFRKLKNEKIPFSEVHLVESDGQLVKTGLQDLLAKIDKDDFYVELQAMEPLAVVKVINRKEAAARKKQAKEQQKQNAKKNVKKEFQFTWGMAMGDLEHRLDRAKAELKRGARVDLVFAPKSGQKAPPVAEMREKMQLIADKVADVGVEWKSRELDRGIGALFMQSSGVRYDEGEEDLP